MKTIVKTILSAVFLSATSLTAQAGNYTFKITNPDNDLKLNLTWLTDNVKEGVNLVNGIGSIKKDDLKAQYVKMAYGRYTRLLYLEPNKDLTIAFDKEAFFDKITFEGENAVINDYLNNHHFMRQKFRDAVKKEAEFIHQADSIYEVNMSILKKNTQLPPYFVNIERERLKYYSYSQLPLYPIFRQAILKNNSIVIDDIFYKKLEELSEIKAVLLDYPEYKDFILNSVLGRMLRNGKAKDEQKQFIDYVKVNVKEKAVLEYIVDAYIYGQISQSGIDDTKRYIDFYHQTVTDQTKRQRFDKLCAQWEKLKSGAPSPTFSYPDIDGKIVSLDNLKGKFVYVDVWATWCGPCRGELPHLKRLEELYSGKNIAFVSLSCDKNKKAWEKTVRSENLKGIQLHMGEDRTFMDSYLIKGIPRFILIDRDGNIIKANALRPSQPQIIELFDELLSRK